MFLRGIRGATTVDTNTAVMILTATEQLLEKMIQDNAIQVDDIASIFFSVTADLNADFPAKAAREMGLTKVPLLCMTEIPVPGSLPMCIRILIHVNTTKKMDELMPIYLNGAVALRPDVLDD